MSAPSEADKAALEAIKAKVVELKKGDPKGELADTILELKRLKEVCGEASLPKGKDKKKEKAKAPEPVKEGPSKKDLKKAEKKAGKAAAKGGEEPAAVAAAAPSAAPVSAKAAKAMPAAAPAAAAPAAPAAVKGSTPLALLDNLMADMRSSMGGAGGASGDAFAVSHPAGEFPVAVAATASLVGAPIALTVGGNAVTLTSADGCLSGSATVARYLATTHTARARLVDTFDIVRGCNIDGWVDMSATLKNPKTCGVVLAQLNSQLEMRVFIEGHSASLADVMLWEVMVMSRAVDKQLPAHPHVARWKAHMDSLPAFKAALASAGASPSAAAAPAAASAAPAKDSAKKAAAPAEGKAAKAPAAAGAADKKADAAAPAGGKKEKKEKKAAPAGGGGKAAAPATDWSGPAISYLDLRVGKIIDCVAVKESDKLYQETIDLGEESGPRTILSGLQQFVKLEDMENRMVCCVINLKPRPMGPDKTKSAGMVLCAQNADHTVVVPVNPPAGAKIGDVISFEGCESTPAGENQVAKKKLWEAAAPDLHTNGDGVACWKDKTWNTPAGPCTAPGMANAPIS